jgi:hypothetical protein
MAGDQLVRIHENGHVMTTAGLSADQARRLVQVVEDQARRQGRAVRCVVETAAGGGDTHGAEAATHG